MTKKRLREIARELSGDDLDALVLLRFESELEEIDREVQALGERRGAVQDRIDAMQAAMGSGQKKRATTKAGKKAKKRRGRIKT